MGNCLNKPELKKCEIEIENSINEEKVSNVKNINSIKSSYILKEVFSFLNINLKLDIVIYNKQLQGDLGIDIENYKSISGKYKIGEKNGKGSEYILNTDILIFEGEYLNGKRNGKGKEYNDNILLFEGEYLDGKKMEKEKNIMIMAK